MLCPYCNKEMETGSFQSKYVIAWLPTTKRKTVAWYEPGEVELSNDSFFKSNAVTAYLCRECKKVMIDFASPDPNFD